MNRKPVFDAVRAMLGRSFRRREIAALDRAIDEAARGEEVFPLNTVTGVTGPRQTGTAGLALIRRFEGLARVRADGRVEAYPDPGTGDAPWTIGWGATGPGIGPGTIWTREQCDARLHSDVARHAADVVEAIGDSTTSQSQFDALVSFHYNTGAIGRATLTRLHNVGDHAGAAREFARWNRAGGRVLAGLTRRRAAEATLYASATE